MSKPALGRGLNALLSGGAKSPAPVATKAAPHPAADIPSAALPPPPGAAVQSLPVHRIHASPLQPRKDFAAESLTELADSIRANGVVQPLVVRKSASGWELIAGERRLRAAILAGLSEVPALERNASDAEVLELALIENLQRENLNPIEEAQGYAQLQQQFQLTQEQIAQKVGRGRVVIANALRLLRLPPEIQDAIRAAHLSPGHAKVILGLSNPADQARVAAAIQHRQLSVRQAEELVAGILRKDPSTPPPSRPDGTPTRDPHVADLENRLRERFATKVGLRYRAGRGSIEIRFSTDDELQRILELTGVSVD